MLLVEVEVEVGIVFLLFKSFSYLCRCRQPLSVMNTNMLAKKAAERMVRKNELAKARADRMKRLERARRREKLHHR